eukprot:3370221-Prymnesium_polylepis.1
MGGVRFHKRSRQPEVLARHLLRASDPTLRANLEEGGLWGDFCAAHLGGKQAPPPNLLFRVLGGEPAAPAWACDWYSSSVVVGKVQVVESPASPADPLRWCAKHDAADEFCYDCS